MKQPSMAPISAADAPPHSHNCDSITELYDRRLGRGQLVAGRCVECGHESFPPTSTCERCESERHAPVQLSGRAALSSADFGEDPDGWAVGTVELAEGFSVRAPLVGELDVSRELTTEESIEVRPAVLRLQGVTVLAFEPAE